MKSKKLSTIAISLSISSIYIHLLGVLEIIAIICGVFGLKDKDISEKDKTKCKLAILIAILNILVTIILIVSFMSLFPEQFEFLLNSIKEIFKYLGHGNPPFKHIM